MWRSLFVIFFLLVRWFFFLLANPPSSGSLVFSLFFSVFPRVSVRRRVFSCPQLPFGCRLLLSCVSRAAQHKLPLCLPPPPPLRNPLIYFITSRSKATVPGHSVCRGAVASCYPPPLSRTEHTVFHGVSPPPPHPQRAACLLSYLCLLHFPSDQSTRKTLGAPILPSRTQTPLTPPPHTLFPTSTIQEIREWKRAGWSQILPSSPPFLETQTYYPLPSAPPPSPNNVFESTNRKKKQPL